MTSTGTQKVLSNEQIEAFYHDEFVEDQTRHFIALLGSEGGNGKLVIDIGGGCGFFARRLAQLSGHRVKVVDMDTTSVEACRRAGVAAEVGDALQPRIAGNEGIVCFNLVLHHLVGASEEVTRGLQRQALAAWRGQTEAVFVNEYIYESYLGNISGWLIFQITKSRVLSWIGRRVATVVPAFKANTFGVGVRFRAHKEWLALFASAGYELRGCEIGADERVSAPLRLLLIRSIRRDSFTLSPRARASS